MATHTYFPSRDTDKATWLTNFAAKFATIASPFGFPAADVTAVQGYAEMFNYLVNLVETFTSEKEERVKYKDLIRSGPIGSSVGIFPVMPVIPPAPAAVPAGIFPIVAQLVQRIKNNPDYTEAIGRDLGIVGAAHLFDAASMKPLLKLVFKGGAIEVQWKKGHASAICIEVDRGDGHGWQFLAIDSVPHYTDSATASAPGIWKYRAMYLLADEPVGQWSDTISISVG